MDVNRPVNEVVREPRGFARARLLDCEVLIYEGVARHFGAEQVSFSIELVADVRDDVLPLRLVYVGRGTTGVEADVTKRACHAHVVGRFDAAGILEILRQRPLLSVELLVDERLQPDDAAGIAKRIRVPGERTFLH